MSSTISIVHPPLVVDGKNFISVHSTNPGGHYHTWALELQARGLPVHLENLDARTTVVRYQEDRQEEVTAAMLGLYRAYRDSQNGGDL